MSSPEKRDHPGELFVLPVRTAEDLECFIRVPWSIYEDDPCRVPPLIVERKEHLSAKNPYFEHARWQAWAVFRKNKPMGRISAQVDQLRLETYGDGTGLFGYLEADDVPAIFGLPLGWLKLLRRLKRHKLKNRPRHPDGRAPGISQQCAGHSTSLQDCGRCSITGHIAGRRRGGDVMDTGGQQQYAPHSGVARW